MTQGVASSSKIGSKTAREKKIDAHQDTWLSYPGGTFLDGQRIRHQRGQLV
jgi:hypothetical protein